MHFLECPCHAKCPLGCMDCDHPACTTACSLPDQNPDKIKVSKMIIMFCLLESEVLQCQSEADQTFVSCYIECDHDIDCITQCTNDYTFTLKRCPCTDRCPGETIFNRITG